MPLIVHVHVLTEGANRAPSSDGEIPLKTANFRDKANAFPHGDVGIVIPAEKGVHKDLAPTPNIDGIGVDVAKTYGGTCYFTMLDLRPEKECEDGNHCMDTETPTDGTDAPNPVTSAAFKGAKEATKTIDLLPEDTDHSAPY